MSRILGLIAAGALGAFAVVGWRSLGRSLRSRRLRQAQREFQLSREHLEAKLFDLSAASGKPRGLRWADCEWANAVTFARSRRSGVFTALVGVTLRFEAEEGGGMEDVPAVAQEKVGCALFHYAPQGWQCGRILFNLSPEQALKQHEQQFEPAGG